MTASFVQWAAASLMLAGATFMFIAAVGIVRMPDLFTRMQAATKTGTAGAGCVLVGTALFVGELQVTTSALLVALFLFLTAPVAAHMLARAGYMTGIPLSPRTKVDELKERFGRGPETAGGTPSPHGDSPPLEEPKRE